jgi:hypothetical protein
MATILDVLDNFFTGYVDSDLGRMPGKTLFQLGEEVRRFTDSYNTSALDTDLHPVYLGGWPSANFGQVNGEMLMSSLLYSGQVLVKDPISDWFSEEQYQVSHKMSARPGYRTQDGDPNVAATRAFLSNTVPRLLALRPLIQSGIVVLVPAERFFLSDAKPIEELHRQLVNTLAGDPVAYSQRFSSADIPVEDNVRGLFVFAGGERENQLRRAIEDGLLYFAREYALARAHGAVYSAPFDHEQYVCREGLQSAVAPAGHVFHAVLRSQMPVFSGLTPGLVAKLHGDENFADFRADLHSIYQGTPVAADEAEVSAYIADQEAALLIPKLQRAEKELDRGTLARVGTAISDSSFALAAGVMTDFKLGTHGAATGLATLPQIVDRWRTSRKSDSSQTIWTALVRHNRTVRQELADVVSQSGATSSEYWGIPAAPLASVVISKGLAILDSVPRPPDVTVPLTGYTEGPYRICECGSGRKFKFCCQGIAIAS